MPLFLACVVDATTGKHVHMETGLELEFHRALDVSKVALKCPVVAYPTVAQAALARRVRKKDPEYTVTQLASEVTVLRIRARSVSSRSWETPPFVVGLTINTCVIRVEAMMPSSVVARSLRHTLSADFVDGTHVRLRAGVLHSPSPDVPAMTRPNGEHRWYANGLLNRDHGLPAIVGPEGLFWFMEGVAHRGGGLPQSLFSCGIVVWTKDGHIHRDDNLPAIVTQAGVRKWLRMDKLHRDDDLPAVVSGLKGDCKWYTHHVLHRDGDKPAIVSCRGAIQKWYRRGKLHRDDDKPAVICTVPKRFMLKWFQDGKVARDGDRPTTISNTIVLWQHLFPSRPNGKPAKMLPCGRREWWARNMPHRGADLPATVDHSARLIEWYVSGELHRDNDNPAQVWYQNDDKFVWQWRKRGRIARPGYLPAWHVPTTVGLTYHSETGSVHHQELVDSSEAGDDEPRPKKIPRHSDTWAHMETFLLLNDEQGPVQGF